MTQVGKVRVYIACSLDGFIAGPGDDLSWLTGDVSAEPGTGQQAPEAALPPQNTGAPRAGHGSGAVEFEDFMAGVGALLMGRRTHDVVAGFGGAWPYQECPVLVATHRPLEPAVRTVFPVSGSIEELVAQAHSAAQGKDVYLDGGQLIRQALDAELIDDMIVTFAPVILGQGHPLFAGAERRCPLEITGHHRYGSGMLQVHARPRQSP